MLSAGQEVTARILEVDQTTRRIRLSLKSLQVEEEKRASDSFSRTEREHRSRRDDGERRHNRERGPQIPTEEISMTIGDFLKARGKEENSSEADSK